MTFCSNNRRIVDDVKRSIQAAVFAVRPTEHVFVTSDACVEAEENEVQRLI
jgi:hypothetical protein